MDETSESSHESRLPIIHDTCTFKNFQTFEADLSNRRSSGVLGGEIMYGSSLLATIFSTDTVNANGAEL